MKVSDILRTKGSAVHTAAPDATLREAVDAMLAHRVGSLLVLDAAGGLAGIVTEREILRTLQRAPADWADLRVADVMSRNVIIGAIDDSVDQMMEVMTRRRARHLPVLDGDRLAGVLSIGDIVKAALSETAFENQLLKNYIRNWPEGD